MAMDKEVDVKLFITCRLCLDEPGSYQIVPCIKGQIYYCFGIEVDPFDGLPQLICKKCKGMLTDYYATKNLFVEKQKQLHDKLPQNSSTPPKSEIVPKESSATAEVAATGAPEKPAAAVPEVAAKVARNDSRKKKKPSWKKAFNKHFVCTICSKSFLMEKSIKKHSQTHKRFINKHEKVFKKYLTVRLNKIDKKKNSTGGLQNVVINKNKIIERGYSQYHNSFYLKKDFEEGKTDTVDRLKNGTDENENVAAKKIRVSSDSSDDQIIKGKKRKTGRLESISSTQTVILEENKDPTNAANMDDQSNTNEMEIVNPDYINLDDTSSDCPKNNTELEKKRIMPKRRQVKAEVADYKAIQNIVTMCHKNYIKKVQDDSDGLTKSTFSESSLKHKVLSLGRKVLNKQGFVCTGLLRYMEHKNLGITWTSTSNEIQKKGSSVRIMTKSKSREDSENDDACWKNLHDNSFCRDSGVEAVLATVPDVRSDDQAPLQSAQTDEDPFAGAPSESNDSNYRSKLLNKTPVANPRQLPKKNNMTETKLVVATDDAAMIPSNSINNGLEDAQVDGDNMCLPIITSTTSLSVNVSEKEKQEVPVLEKPAPRIKVKPASELMTARALNNRETTKDIWAFNTIQSSLPHHLTNTAVTVHSPMTNSHNALVSNSHTGDQRQQNAYILLDSLQFPNTKTLAPFQYFRKVLLVHGLQLLDLNEDLPEHFNCLIKFRLKLKQDTKRPIEVLLSLHCSKDYFCFSFKDTNSKKFDPNQLSAFWQWELLKIYKTDVTDKILENAIKVGKEVHEHTKLFLSLLKSINLIKEA
ncbi:uncharacterized protein LOC134679216 isoform X2 [Cydia fagiglandana]|uniref:uncharacterized protein LOC134679216 isoform X2 n=1 Tax=Cydia fagiglandana TaxID=1458189 RepID=UPI002FEE1B0B